MAQHNEPGWEEIFTSPPTVASEMAEDPAAEGELAAAPRSRREARGRREAQTPTNSSPRRRRRWVPWVIVLAVIVGLGGGSAAFVWANFEDQVRKVMGWEIPPEDYSGTGTAEASIVIAQGDNGDIIATKLLEAGVIKSYDAFYPLILKQNPVFFPGVYALKEQMSAQAALDALLDPANKLENMALIGEGADLTQAFEVLSAATGTPVADFEAAVLDPLAYGVAAEAPSLEGYLFPARYSLDPGTDAVTVIRTLVNRTFQSLDAAGVAPEDRHRVLTIASLIQREAGSYPGDFEKVSRVIQNRVAQGMMLQFDSTAHYGYAITHGKREVGGVFSTKAELTDNNPYNTYVHTGLPPGPISAAGDAAIAAAIAPAEGTWLYFVAVNLETGETKFTDTLAQHNAAVKEMQAWCRETKSPNCAG
jgi:UPF0755 protein